MLSQTSEHAVRAVLHLAQRAPAEPVPAEVDEARIAGTEAGTPRQAAPAA